MRKNLIRMIQHVNMLDPLPTENSPEYWFYDKLLTDEMIDLVLQVPLRKPMYIKDLAKKVKKSVVETARIVDECCKVGILYYERDEKGVDRVFLEVFAPGNFEIVGMDPKMTAEHPELAYAFPKYVEGLRETFRFFPMGQALMRTIPVEKAVENDAKHVDLEEVSYWIEKNAPSLCVSDCQCRRFRRYNGEGTNDLEGDWCISLGEYAESLIRMNKARRISKEEAYEICRRAEEMGYVHQLSNIDEPDKSVFICNCNWDSCMALRTSWYTQTPNMSRSNFTASVTPSKCVACGGCVEVCPQNAVKLGQKLCEKVPTPIAEEKIPEDHVWPKKNYKSDLLTNRKNVVDETGTAPCKTQCPAHIAVQGYLQLAKEGRYEEALQLIKKENPLPAVCGSICSRKCEQACTRGDIDAPVAIDDIKRFLAERELSAETRYIPKKRFDQGKKIAVIGSGPAGLSCAYFLSIYGHEVTVFEKEEKLGGMLTLGIPSYRLEKATVEAEIDVLRQMGVIFKTGVEVGKDVTLNELRAEGFKGFFLGIGAQGGRKLGVEGEDACGVLSGVSFLKQVNLGKQAPLAGKAVVVGGGNVAVDVARTAIRSGADEVSMYCLESRRTMPASEEEVQEAEEEGILVNGGWGPKRILTKNGKVVGVEFKRCLSTIDPQTKAFSPIYDEEDTMTVACDYVIAAIGQSIEWGSLLEGSAVQLNRNNTAKTVPVSRYEIYKAAKYVGRESEWVELPEPIEVWQTSEPDIFVGGDAHTGPRFAIDAIAEGHEAAESLHRFVWEGHSLVLARDRKRYHYLNKDNMVVEEFDKTPRVHIAHDSVKVKTFSDPRIPLTEEQVKTETSRCLGCGAAQVQPNICIGCGLCTTKCKFDAIHLEKTFDAWPVPYEKVVPRLAKNVIAREGRIIKRALKGNK